MFKEALASGYLLQFLDAFCDIGEHGDEVIIAQEDLTFYVVPDGWNTDSILDEFLIVSLRGAPCITKLQKQPLCTQAICGGTKSTRAPITAPRPSFRLLGHFCPYWIQDDISACLQKMALLLDQYGFEPSLQDVTDLMVIPIEFLGVDAIEMLHPPTESSFHRFDDNVVVVSHEAVGVTQPIEEIAASGEVIKEHFSVVVIKKNRFPVITTRGDVVDSTRILYA